MTSGPGAGPPGARPARSSMRAGMRAAVAPAIAVGGFGFSFAILAREAGIGPVAATLMSATTFAGSAQFAAAGILEAGGSAVGAIWAAVMLNARYGPIGISVAPVLGGSPWRRVLLAQLVVDESWAVAHVGDGRFDRGRLIGAGVLLYVAWVGSTALGTLGAGFLADPEALGLDAAFPALFLALLWPQLRGRRPIEAAVLGGAIALALVPFTPPGVPIIAAAAACLVGARRT